MVDISEIGIICVRCIFTLITLFLVTKIMGKKQLSQLTVYDYIVSITIGSLAADIILTLEDNLIYGIVAIFIYGFIGFFLSFLSIKSECINEFLNGKATILMEDGNFHFENLKKTKMPIYKFIEQARLNGYYDLNVLKYAILETNGEISFLPKEEYQTSTPIDFKTEIKKGTKQSFFEEIIVDGQVNYDNLQKLGKSKKWLKDELKKKNVDSFDKILLATLNEKGKIRIYKEIK